VHEKISPAEGSVFYRKEIACTMANSYPKL
jgi:hypothetical protein